MSKNATAIRGLLEPAFWANMNPKTKEQPCTEAHARNPNRERRTYSHGPYGILTKEE